MIADVTTAVLRRSGERVPALEPTELTDEELTALALAADPSAPLAPGAVPVGPARDWSLPMAYLPPAARVARPHSPVRTVAIFVVIAAFLAITGLGFCATYGSLVVA